MITIYIRACLIIACVRESNLLKRYFHRLALALALALGFVGSRSGGLASVLRGDDGVHRSLALRGVDDRQGALAGINPASQVGTARVEQRKGHVGYHRQSLAVGARVLAEELDVSRRPMRRHATPQSRPLLLLALASSQKLLRHH